MNTLVTTVAVALAVLTAAIAGLFALILTYLRRLDAGIRRLNVRYTPPPKPTIPTPAIPALPPMRPWTSQR